MGPNARAHGADMSTAFAPVSEVSSLLSPFYSPLLKLLKC